MSSPVRCILSATCYVVLAALMKERKELLTLHTDLDCFHIGTWNLSSLMTEKVLDFFAELVNEKIPSYNQSSQC